MATQTSAEIQAQMQKVARVRQQALDEEKARLARENAFKQTQQEAEAELVRLQRQLVETRFDEVLVQSDALVAEQERAVLELTTALDGVVEAVAKLYPHVNRVEDIFERQQAKHDEAMGTLNELWRVLPPVEAVVGNRDGEYETVARNGAILREHDFRVEPAWSLPFALLNWVSQAQQDDHFKLRAGVAYALIGRLFEMDRQRLPTTQMLRAELKKQTRKSQQWR